MGKSHASGEISARARNSAPRIGLWRCRIVGTAIALGAHMDVISQIEKRLGFQPLPNAMELSHIVAVPAVEWCGFLERFSRRHRGWMATIHGFAREVPLTRIPSQPIHSVALERCDSDYLIRVTLANGLSLCAQRPRAIRIQTTSEGAETALEVETAAGAFMRLAFRATALPDQLDGVAPAELNAHPH
jgi:hypothetical protein